jgi:hypothetical protein
MWRIDESSSGSWPGGAAARQAEHDLDAFHLQALDEACAPVSFMAVLSWVGTG